MTFEEYMGLSINWLKNLPETKKDLFYIIKGAIGNGRSAIVCGNRRVGKTTLFKQLAAQVPDTLYVTFELAEDTEVATMLTENIVNGIVQGRYRAVFIDEVTKAFYYDEKMKTIVDVAWQHKVNIFITSSCTRYLRQLAYGMLGARVALVEMSKLSYLEYLFMFGKAAGERKYTDEWNLVELEGIVPELLSLGANRESFMDYLMYCQKDSFGLGLRDYIEASYSDLLASDQALSIMRGQKVNREYDVAKELLYVQQYPLITSYQDKKAFYKAVTKYGREWDALGKIGVKKKDVTADTAKTRLSEKMGQLQSRDRKQLLDALSILYQLGLVKKVCTVEADSELWKELAEGRREREFCADLSVDDVFSSLYVTSDIGTYLCILRDFMGELGLVVEREILQGSLLGEIVEYCVRSQIMAVANEDIGVKLRFGRLRNTKEIDIYAEELRLLAEVGIGGKSSADLAFCNEDFGRLYEGYAACDRLLVSGIEDGYRRHEGYVEVAYWVLVAYADLVINGRIHRWLS